MTQKSGVAGRLRRLFVEFSAPMKLARRLHVSLLREMATVGRVLLWTLVLVAPGGFLLVPVLAATSLATGRGNPQTTRERFAALFGSVRSSLLKLQRYWTKR